MIKIEISGKVGVGKTTLALSIGRYLLDNGFSNIMIDDIDVSYDTDYPEFQEKRMEVIQNRYIEIQTIQSKKNIFNIE